MEVLSAEDGRQALQALRANEVDLVLMDIMMPEMDGYEATRHIRTELGAALPVVALTAKAMKGDREKCLEAGATDHVTKPVDPDQLVSVVRVWLSSGHAAAASGVKEENYSGGAREILA
jgi:CheY-like chemotaxis protein